MYQEIVIPTLISFAISVALGPIMIPFLRKLKVDTQYGAVKHMFSHREEQKDKQ